ncbi:sulfite exporter TauE/SafE family protein [Frankia sp. AgKG'84/4]|uniref:sulfite exporter TauE/SafE family protein n=1 Tax=Frankia sp. AgKG'84/4 TaxID=573490 RepID=UPI00200DC17D|nr:sulfite exporter TauE/SafE family protein [Frankia sp. AgKG'84/4]MCL9795092.1 sulfite exporter TauE/SafE family protein [Frankia sp. AgKG'84/4]
MTFGDVALLVSAGILAGLASTVAGLASLVSYPALLVTGLSPLAANVTNTTALLFVAVGAAAGSRPELVGQSGRVARFGAATFAGGAVGAALLLTLPAAAFERAVPVLIAGAAVLLWVQPRQLARRGHHLAEDGPVVLGAVFVAGIYLGYFGAGGGIALLAVLAVAIPLPLARVNAIKNVSSGFANLVAAAGFAVFGPVRWAAVAPLAAGLLIGGAVGPLIARRLPAGILRGVIGLAALGLAASLAWRAYG